MPTDSIVIVSAARTPMGNFQGSLAQLTAPQLGSVAIRGAVERACIDARQVDEVIFGNVLPAGLGQAPARQASLAAGLPLSAGCTTISKMCGSGMKAVMLAHDLLLAGSAEVMVAGGMESMSNAPHLLAKARAGLRMGHASVLDHMFTDGLEDAYEKGRLMGSFAEDCADRYQFSREAQDKFAVSSLEKALRAVADGSFEWEIEAVTVKGRAGDRTVSQDEAPGKVDLAKIPLLKPAFRPEGTVTPANSSSISDGAAALVLMKESKARTLGVAPLARVLGHATHAHEPAWFSTAPVGALQSLFRKTGLQATAYDLFEINEAFAVVTMAAMRDLDLPPEKVNVHGGACALGHPIGASGARIIVTLLAALRRHGGRRGAACLCIGGGEATAVGIELV